MDLGIDGKVALVTGASKGIGRAIAAELAAEGARVAITSRSGERAAAAAEEVGAEIGLEHDAADLDGVEALLARVERDLGPVDILVPSTGGPPAGPDALGFTREEWETAHRTLTLHPMAFVERVMPGMRERGWGRIVNVASTSAIEAIPYLVLSNAHRAGTLAAFKTLARQVAADGVTLNTLLTGRIDTERLMEMGASREQVEAFARAEVPAARLGRPEEMAAAAAFLCSQRAAYITGVALAVDGGLMRSL
jgi:3-oxoacyl-[acyl-carrier protein] reductase